MYEQIATQDVDALVEVYAPLVKRIAHHLMLRFPASVQVDDLIQAGMVGLLEAARNYNGAKGASFETYAGIRIRGAMIDDVRKGDWVPRSVHRNSRRIAAAVKAIEDRQGREATDVEIAAELGVALDEYFNFLTDTNVSRLFSLDELCTQESQLDIPADPNDVSPSQAVQASHLRAAISEQINDLPEREKLVLALYYDEELNLKEIGQVLGVSESRVSQIHSQAMLRLRGRLSDWLQHDLNAGEAEE
ncbi:MAG: RNA polymerase sigma factor FliA [Pseudomonadales bacterium]